jgi:hypothetical protein
MSRRIHHIDSLESVARPEDLNGLPLLDRMARESLLAREAFARRCKPPVRPAIRSSMDHEITAQARAAPS